VRESARVLKPKPSMISLHWNLSPRRKFGLFIGRRIETGVYGDVPPNRLAKPGVVVLSVPTTVSVAPAATAHAPSPAIMLTSAPAPLPSPPIISNAHMLQPLREFVVTPASTTPPPKTVEQNTVRKHTLTDEEIYVISMRAHDDIEAIKDAWRRAHADTPPPLPIAPCPDA
jgi:hypothetical protein